MATVLNDGSIAANDTIKVGVDIEFSSAITISKNLTFDFTEGYKVINVTQNKTEELFQASSSSVTVTIKEKMSTRNSDIYTTAELAGNNSKQDGDLFEVSSNGTNNKKYFSNIYAALNHIYGGDALTKTVTRTRNSENTANIDTLAYVTTTTNNPYYVAGASGSIGCYTATIKLLQDVVDGQPIAFGGVVDDIDLEAEVQNKGARKSNITIDLDGFNYNFSEPALVTNGKNKAITTAQNAKPTNSPEEGASFPADLSTLTIQNGSMSVEAQPKSGEKFQRIVKSYVNLTFDDVTIDATNLKGQAGGEDGAAICHSAGTLTLSGKTTVKVQPNTGEDIYYAVSGKLFNNGSSSYTNDSPVQIDVNLDDGYSIPNVGLYGWVRGKGKDTDYAEYPKAFPKEKLKLNVIKGTIGEVTVDGVAVDKQGITSYSSTTKQVYGKGTSYITVTASTDNISLGANAHSLASFGLFDMDTTAANKNTFLLYQKNGANYPYTYAIEGWNRQTAGDDTELNYVASLGSDDQPISTGSAIKQGKGDWLINVKNVSDKADLVLDGTHSLFGIPTSATAELKNKKYKLVNVKYNTAKDAVTLTGGDYSKDAFIAPKTSAAATDGILAESIKTIDASDISVDVSIIGSSLGSAIYDGKGDNVVSLGSGVDTLIFGGGADSIKEFASTDFIKLSRNIDPVTDASKVASLASDGFVLGFGSSDSIKLQGYNSAFTGDGKKFLTGVNVEASNGDNYVYTKQSIAYKAKNSSVYGSLTFTSAIADTISYDASNESTFYTIDAGAVQHSTSLTGEGNDNRLIGSAEHSNRLYGKAGNDFLKGSTVTAEGDVFVYSDGNDTIDGFKATDKANITSARLNGFTGAKLSRNKLVFTADENNSLTFNIDGNDSAVEKIILQDSQDTTKTTEKAETVKSGGFLTQDGYVNVVETTTSLTGMAANTPVTVTSFKLFSGAKGNIDFVSGANYKGASINAIDATAGKNSVTLTADDNVRSLELASNKKRDQFVYGGGNITISGFETGKDRINIAEVGPIYAFSVGGGDVAISVTSDTKNVVSLKGAAGEEVLMHDFGSKGNSYQKFVFAKTGVLYNKEKNPTKVNIYSNVGSSFTVDDSVKKIFLESDVAGVSIQSGNNKSTLDASAAGKNNVGVSLVGGTKNNKFIGTDYADTFYYYGGKDNITNFSVAKGTTDSIVLSDTSKFDINEAKITLSKKSLKFKFDNKNTLALKSDSAIDSLTIGTETYKFAKNAIGDGEGKVSLTSAFSGTYKLADGVTSVDGGAVLKNLTFKGTSADESLVGGTKKTTFKGNGGDDTLVGGTGKDIFFYAKGDKGDTEIQNFDFGTDKLKIANGTLHTITVDGNSIQFAMTSGKKGDENKIASFNLTSYDSDAETPTALGDKASKVVFKANNTHYWFAQDEVTGTDESGTATTLAKQGQLITLDRKVTARDVAALDLDVIDLGYSTNLVKTGVAVKVTGTLSNLLPTKTTTPTTTP